MADIAFLAGALIPTFLISRLAFWVLKKWNGSVAKIAVANVASFLVIFTIAKAAADGYPLSYDLPDWLMYALPQSVWVIVDLIRYRKKSLSNEASEIIE